MGTVAEGMLADLVLLGAEDPRLRMVDVATGQLAGAMEAPMAMLATAMESKVQEMAGLLDALKQRALMYSTKIESSHHHSQDPAIESSEELSLKIEKVYTSLNAYVRGLDLKSY